MIKIFQNDSVINANIENNSIIFSSSNNLLKIKKKFINMDIVITTLDNYIRKIISDKYNKKLIDNTKSYLYMYLAFNNVKDALEKYNDIMDVSFINLLVNTYNFYKENKVSESTKTKTLKIIFDEFEKLLYQNNYITKYELYSLLNSSLDEIKYDNIYFEDIRKLNNYEIELINNLKENKNIYLYANTLNNESLVEDLNKIKTIVYEESESIDVNELFKIGSKGLFNGINLVACNDLYEEIRFISNDIKTKINNGLKFKDILVISNDVKRYENYFNLLFDFPYSKDTKYGVLTKNFIDIFSKIIKGDFSCHNFISILKLGIIKIDRKIVDDLDNYVYMWNLEDTLFYEEFIFNTSGKRDFTEYDYKKLELLNETKLEIINPIKYLISNIKDETNASSILKYLFTYFDEEEIVNNLALYDYEGYIKLVDLFEVLSDTLNEITINDLLDILNNCYSVFSKNDKKIDEVNILSLDDYIKDEYKQVYFIGLTEKDLPSKYSYSTLINNNDLEDKVIFDLMRRHSSSEKNLISNVLLNKNVILTYHKLTDSSSKVGPSSILSKFNAKNISYKYELNKDVRDNFDLRLDEDIAINLYGNNLVLSPSSLEMFAKCKYSYFLNYGLKLNIKEKMIFDNREVGTFVHYILENCIKDNVTYDNIDVLIDKYTKEYFCINLRNSSNTINYVIDELKISTKILLNTILSELDNTKFNTKYTELKIKDMNFCIKLDKGEIKITGIVDRVDTFEDNENYYYRVIDYKTGTKKFRLDDVLNGLNMQMIIYLMAIKNSNITNKKIIPTGFLYYPALVHYNKENIGTSDEVVLENLRSNLKMNGILNKESIDLYDIDVIGNYIDVISRKNINEQKVLDNDELDLVFEKVLEILKDEGNSMLSGDIKVNPIIDSKNDSCKYCLFSSICKFNKEKNKPRRYKSISNKDVIKSLEGDLNGMD